MMGELGIRATATAPDPGAETAELDTKERILVAAERLVAERGFDAFSLRELTTEAGTNLAAVHYHFGSKEGLIETLIARYIAPINFGRLKALDELEHAAGERPVPVADLVDAFMRPILERLAAGGVSEQFFFRLLGRCFGERGYRLPESVMPLFHQCANRFLQAFLRVLPGIREEVLFWRMHFVFGAITHTLAHGETLHLVTNGRSGKPTPDQVMNRLKAFAVAGLTAPDTPEHGTRASRPDPT